MTVTGTAADNTGISAVWCRANSQPWVKADGTTSWTASLTLEPGANTVQAYAVDLAGNDSTTASASVTYVVSDQLGLSVTGQGTLTPNYQNAVLEVGKTYKLTAKPAIGQIFSHWEDETGTILSRNAALTFTMRNDLQLKAVFVPNPFIPTKGSYAGLAFNPGAASHANSGLFTATVTDKGKLTSKLLWAGATHSLSGQLAGDGSFSNAVVRKGLSPLTVELQLSLNGERKLTGTIRDGTVTSELLANQLIYSAASPAPLGNRKFTFVIPGAEDSAARPGGYGYGTISITAAGAATLGGVLGDGTKFTQKTFVSKDGTLPFYVALYAAKGSILGWLSLAGSGASSDVTGTLRWTKTAGSAGLYPSGFSFPEGLEVTGSLFASTSPMLNWTSGYVALELGGLTGDITNYFTVAANKVTGTNKMALTLVTSTGLFKGNVVNPATGRPLPVNGVVLQNQGLGYGYFAGTGQTGRVRVAPQN